MFTVPLSPSLSLSLSLSVRACALDGLESKWSWKLGKPPAETRPPVTWRHANEPRWRRTRCWRRWENRQQSGVDIKKRAVIWLPILSGNQSSKMKALMQTREAHSREPLQTLHVQPVFLLNGHSRLAPPRISLRIFVEKPVWCCGEVLGFEQWTLCSNNVRFFCVRSFFRERLSIGRRDEKRKSIALYQRSAAWKAKVKQNKKYRREKSRE